MLVTLDQAEPQPADVDLPTAWTPPPVPAAPSASARTEPDDLPAILRGPVQPPATQRSPGALAGPSPRERSEQVTLPDLRLESPLVLDTDLPDVLRSDAGPGLPAPKEAVAPRAVGTVAQNSAITSPALEIHPSLHQPPTSSRQGGVDVDDDELPAILAVPKPGLAPTSDLLPEPRTVSTPKPAGPVTSVIDGPTRTSSMAPPSRSAERTADSAVAVPSGWTGELELPVPRGNARSSDLPTLARPTQADRAPAAFGELDLPLLAAEPPVLSAALPVPSTAHGAGGNSSAGLPVLSRAGAGGSARPPRSETLSAAVAEIADRDWLSLPPEPGPAASSDPGMRAADGAPELSLDATAQRARPGGGGKTPSTPHRDEFGDFELPEDERGASLDLDSTRERISGPAPNQRVSAAPGVASADTREGRRIATLRPSPASNTGAASTSLEEDLPDLTNELSFSSAPPKREDSAAPQGHGLDDDMEFGAIPQVDSQVIALDALPAPSRTGVGATTAARSAVAPLPKRRRLLLALLVSFGLLGGASLEVVGPYGAFGRHYVSDLAHADGYRALQSTTVDSARRLLANDVYSDAMSAITLTESAHAKAPRVVGLLAYGAYLGYMNELRFGRSPTIEAHANQQLARVGSDPSFYAELARVAETAVGSRIPRARQLVETLAQQKPRDADVTLLAAELALVAKEPMKALEEFRKAEEILGPTGRTAFGIARAFWAAGDEAHALEAARTVIERSKNHAAARVLLARTLWSRGDEAQALAILGEVIAVGPIREAASQAELVDGLTLTSRIHMARSRMSQAEAALVEALRIDGKSGAALAGMGEVLYREGRYTDALAKFDAGILADPEGVQAKIGSAKAKIALERLQEAKDSLKKLRDARQNDPEISLWLGRAEEALGDKAAAEKSYQEAILVGGTKPEAVDAYMGLAQLMVRDGRVADADTLLAEARRKLPGSLALHQGLGDVHFQAGRFEAAKAEFEAAVQRDPQDLAARFRLAITLRRMGKFDPAAEEFDRIASRDPQYPGLALERGLLYEANNRIREALDYYQEALAKAPDDPDLLLRVGSAEVASGHAAQAEEILRKVVSKRPNSAEVNHYLGRALLLKGSNLAEGLRFLQRAVEIDPNRADYHLYVGWAANEAGQPAVARQELDRALELDKGLADAYWQKGELLRKQSAIVDAMRFAEKALELRPSRYEAYATMAQCYQDQNRTTEAIGAWRKAIAANENVPEWHYRLGKLLGRAGEPELAKAVQLAELVDSKPGWLGQAYFELAESEQASGKRSDAIEHFRRFLITAKPDSPYRSDAKKALVSLGAPYGD